jgi:integrase
MDPNHSAPPVRAGVPTAADLQVIASLFERFPQLFPGLDARGQVTVAEVIDKYLAHAGEELTPDALENRTADLNAFCADLGSRPVGQLSPLDLKQFLAKNAKRWQSGHKRAGVATSVKRAFNWAVEMRLIRENPVGGLRLNVDKKTGRDVTPAEFQAALRHSDPYFRRFLIALKLTGARPCELRALHWRHIDWARGLAILPDHKTKKKTGKPRVIVLVPSVLKLLAIVMRDQHGPAAVELRRILQYAPDRTMPAKDVCFRMRQLGFSYRAVYLARKTIGAVKKRIGGWAAKGYTAYHLPENAVTLPPAAGDYVFVCSKQRPWTRHALARKFRRLARKIGLPDDCKVYGVRHYFITAAVKRGGNLKAIATLVGHSTTVMIERVYTHLEGDVAFLHQAALAAIALAGSPQTMPLPTDAEAWQQLLLDRFPRARPKPQRKKPGGPRPLNDAEKTAWQAYQFAREQAPDLTTVDAVYAWLQGRREFAGQLPPTVVSFRRYVGRARLHYRGMSKRKARWARHESNGTHADGDAQKGGAA